MMISTKDHTHSIWQKTDSKTYEALSESLNTDICVVGAGIAGLSVAYELAKTSGQRVVVVDDGEIGGRQTLRTSAHISNAFDDFYYKLIQLRGREDAQLVAESHTLAIQKIRGWIETEKIDCDWADVDGYLFCDPSHDKSMLEKELQAAHDVGLADVKMLNRIPGQEIEMGPCLRFPNQGQFHAGKFIMGLAEAAVKAGAHLYRRTRVVDMQTETDSVFLHTLQGHTIKAKKVILATNVPIHTLSSLHFKQAAYRTYMIAARVMPGTYSPALIWDTANPYHYVRHLRQGSRDYLLIGGEDHRTGQAPRSPNPLARLEVWARQHFPHIQSIDYSWSGQIMEPADGMAFIGAVSPNVYVVTGDSGHGLTHAAIASMILPSLVLGHFHPLAKLYDPHRLTLKSAGTLVEENLNTAAQYADWLLPKHSASKVVQDSIGEVHKMSAVCTHLGGIVHWNELEKTWDCPCHGSRFNAAGEVINGPACQNLKLSAASAQEVSQIKPKKVKTAKPKKAASLSKESRP